MTNDELAGEVEDLREWVAALNHIIGAIILSSPDPAAIVRLIGQTISVDPPGAPPPRPAVTDKVRKILTELRGSL